MFSRISRRTVFLTSIVATAVSFFTLGMTGARLSDAGAQASYEATLAANRSEVRRELGKGRRASAFPAGTAGRLPAGDADRAQMVAEIKQELQTEMGLVPVQLLRDRQGGFVALVSSHKLRQ